MGKIIASQLNLDGGQAFTGAIVLCALLSTCATYAFIKNGFKKGFHHEDIIMNICTIVFTIMLIIGAYTSINHSQTQQNEYNVVKQATSKVPYYNLTKDGVLIIANKKMTHLNGLLIKLKPKSSAKMKLHIKYSSKTNTPASTKMT